MLEPFVFRAILGIIFTSFAAPISVIMLLRGALYITPEISHAALGGAAIGVLIQMFFPELVDPFLFVMIFCIATSILVSRMGKSSQQALGMMLSVSLAISVTLYVIVRDYLPIDRKIMVDGYLVSDLLLLSDMDVLCLALASTIAVIITTILYREFVYMCFDMETMESFGLRVGLYDMLLFATSAMTIAVIARTMGVLLSVTFLIIPAAASRLLTRRISNMLAISFIIAVFSGLGGIALSLLCNIPTSGAIALLSILLFLSTYMLNRFLKK